MVGDTLRTRHLHPTGQPRITRIGAIATHPQELLFTISSYIESLSPESLRTDNLLTTFNLMPLIYRKKSSIIPEEPRNYIYGLLSQNHKPKHYICYFFLDFVSVRGFVSSV